MATEFKYWAFISYSHADKKWGDWLHGALETFKVPKLLANAATATGEELPRRIFPIFRDREELPTSSDLSSMITHALEQSRCLIVICSPRAAKSRWVNEEILDFKRLGKAERILALIVDGEPNAAEGKPGFSVEAECFPEALRYALGADGNLDKNRPTEPIAADARPGMDGRTNAKLKLVAGILGINYDDLKRREERRRRRQQRIVLTVSTALVLTFAGLAAAAFLQWRMATRETEIANAQTQEAERQKTEANTQRAAAEKQKTLAQEATVQAENEKEQVESQTAADEEDIAREALLRGDSLTAAQHLSLAFEAEPQDAAVRLLLQTAMSNLNGLATVLNGGSGTFTNMEVSPQSGLVLTVTSDGEAQVWDPKKSAPVLIFGKSGNLYNQVHTAEFTPDGKGVLLDNNSEAYLQEIATGKKVSFSAGTGQGFAGLMVSSDGKTVMGSMLNISTDGKAFSTQIATYSSSDGHQLSQATIPGIYSIVALPGSAARAILIGGPDTTNPARQVPVVDVATGKIVFQIPVAWNDVALLNPRGDLILINHSTPTQPPDIYSAQTGAHVAQLSANGVSATHATWSPSGRYVLSAYPMSGGSNEALWDASTWKPIHVWPNAVWSATAIDPAESHLASVTGYGEFAVWDLHSGALLKKFDDVICAGDLLNAPSTLFSHMQFSPDGTRLINAGGGACATIWNWQQVRSSQLVYSGSGATINGIAFSPDGSRAVLADNDGRAVVWNVVTGAAQFTLQSKTTQSGAAVNMAFFTPDGKEVVTGGMFLEAALWNAGNGSLLRVLNFDKHAIVAGDAISVAMVRPGNRAVTFSSDGWGALWDLAAQKQLATLHTEDGATVRKVSPAPDGREFVVIDTGAFAFVFDSLSGALKRKLGKPGTPLVAAEISLQGDKLLTADAMGKITIWSLADGRALQTINGAAGAAAVNDVHFSPDGSTILAAWNDGKARTWNAQTGQPELTIAEETVPGEMPGMGAPFRSDLASGTPIQAGMLRVEYSPDGSFIAGANQGINVLVWDAKTGKQLLRLEGHTGRIASLAFSSDGTRLGSSSEDGTARIWDVGLENRSPAEIKQEIAEFGQKSSR
jgi:WD40 repeat protein